MLHLTRYHLVTIIAVLFLGPVPVAHAVDGVIEINHISALAGNVTPGDTAGYPVTISEPGSYRLTGISSPQTDLNNVIEIDANSVTLDLNGFSILGGQICTETGTVPNVIDCVEGGSADNGIAGTSQSPQRLRRSGHCKT